MFRALVCASVVLVTLPTLPVSETGRVEQQQRDAAGTQPRWLLHTSFESLNHAILITVAPHLFVAYDADTCAYRAAWSGGLTFTEQRSAIPMVERKGDIQSEGIGGIPWEVRRDGELVPCKVRYRGCTFDGENATPSFEIAFDDAAPPIRIEETPTILTESELDDFWLACTYDRAGKRPDDWDPRMLRRSFLVQDLPAGLALSMRYARTVKSMTSWPGFDGKRDPRADEFETANGVLVEPLILTFTGESSATTLECIEPK